MSVLYSKLRLNVPSDLDGQNAIITNSRGATRTVEMSSPVTDIMLVGMEKYTVQAGVSEENISFGYGQIKKMNPKLIPANLESATWKEISNTIKNGTFSQFASVGDTKSFVLNGKTYHAQVVAINDGTGTAGQWYPDKTVDFISVELYESKIAYNSTSTNAGGFPGSALKETLANTIYPLFPSDLKNVIIDKSHSYNTATTSSGGMTTFASKLWLPTRFEIIGFTSSYIPGESTSNNKKYTLSSKIKNQVEQTSATSWWLGSLSNYHNYTFDSILQSGDEDPIYPNASGSRGVPLCFRIG